MVVRTIRVIADDGQTEIAQLNIQDGGMAAEVIIPQDWRTAKELDDMAVAFSRMAEVVRQYTVSGVPDGD